MLRGCTSDRWPDRDRTNRRARTFNSHRSPGRQAGTEDATTQLAALSELRRGAPLVQLCGYSRVRRSERMYSTWPAIAWVWVMMPSVTRQIQELFEADTPFLSSDRTYGNLHCSFPNTRYPCYSSGLPIRGGVGIRHSVLIEALLRSPATGRLPPTSSDERSCSVSVLWHD